jgi:hypothetical protein
MNSFQIKFEAARQQGFRDATNPPVDEEWREKMDTVRQDMYGIVYTRGYDLGRRQARTICGSRASGITEQPDADGGAPAVVDTVAQRENKYQKGMIDGLALRLEEDIVHAMTVVCRQEAEIKATQRAARVYGFDRVFNSVLHPRARAHLDDFIKRKADEFEAEFRKTHSWNTHHCEEVQNDLRLLEGRVQDRDTALYAKKKIAQAKTNAEAVVKRKKENLKREAGIALGKITEFANQWKAKTGGEELWTHEGHRRASFWEQASNRAENLALVRSRMFPALDGVDTSEQDAWADALFAGKIFLQQDKRYPRPLLGFSAGGVKIWLWWLLEQTIEREEQEQRIEAQFEEENQRRLYVQEAAERKRKLQEKREESRRASAEKRAEDAVRRERQRQNEAEQRRREAERAAKEEKEEAERRAAETAARALEDRLMEESAQARADEAKRAEDALLEVHEQERANERRADQERILQTIRAQNANAAGVEEVLRQEHQHRVEAERRRREAERAAKKEKEEAERRAAETAAQALEDALMEEYAQSRAEEAKRAEDALLDVHELERANQESLLQTIRAELASAAAAGVVVAAGDALAARAGELSGAEFGTDDELGSDEEDFTELDSDTNGSDLNGNNLGDAGSAEVARKAFFEKDKRMRTVLLKKYASLFESAGDGEQDAAKLQLQDATRYLFDQTAMYDVDNGNTYYEFPNGVPTAERLFLAVSLGDEFFVDAQERNKTVKHILAENDAIKQGREGVAIELDGMFNKKYFKAVKTQAENYSIPPLQKNLDQWRRLLRVRERTSATGQTSRIVAEVVQAFEEEEDEEGEETEVETDVETEVEESGGSSPRTVPKTFNISEESWNIYAQRNFLAGTSSEGEVIVGDKLIVYANNQDGNATYIVKQSPQAGTLMLQPDYESSESSESSESFESSESSDFSAGGNGETAKWGVAEPVALVAVTPMGHARTRNAFAKVLFKHASAFASRFAPALVKTFMPKPAALPVAVPVVLARAELAASKPVSIYTEGQKPFSRLAKGSLFFDDLPVVPENMSR